MNKKNSFRFIRTKQRYKKSLRWKKELSPQLNKTPFLSKENSNINKVYSHQLYESTNNKTDY
jgi:hypothetical protein